jgi:hypothetical protein
MDVIRHQAVRVSEHAVAVLVPRQAREVALEVL